MTEYYLHAQIDPYDKCSKQSYPIINYYFCLKNFTGPDIMWKIWQKLREEYTTKELEKILTMNRGAFYKYRDKITKSVRPATINSMITKIRTEKMLTDNQIKTIYKPKLAAFMFWSEGLHGLITEFPHEIQSGKFHFKKAETLFGSGIIIDFQRVSCQYYHYAKKTISREDKPGQDHVGRKDLYLDRCDVE